MLTSGRVVFTNMEEVIYGKPAAQTVAELVESRGAERVFLMVSGTLNRQTDEIEKLPPRARQQMRRHLRQDAGALAALGGDRRRRAGARGQAPT